MALIEDTISSVSAYTNFENKNLFCLFEVLNMHRNYISPMQETEQNGKNEICL